MIKAESAVGTRLVLVGLAVGLVSLVLPAGVVLGAPITGYELLIGSFASWAGPFHQWQDYYITLAAVVNVALFLVLPVGLIWRARRATFAAIAVLSAVYVISFPAVFPQTNEAYFAWLVAISCIAFGHVRLARPVA